MAQYSDFCCWCLEHNNLRLITYLVVHQYTLDSLTFKLVLVSSFSYSDTKSCFGWLLDGVSVLFLQLLQYRYNDEHGGAEWKCPHCFKIMNTSEKMKKHMMIHIQKPYKCDICNRGFKRKDHLNEHRRTHTGEKPYACHLCSFRSTQSSNLKSHIRNKHTNVNEIIRNMAL